MRATGSPSTCFEKPAVPGTTSPFPRSPASMALGMTMNGAEGETWNQMREALGFGGLTEDEINAGYASLIQILTGLDPAVRPRSETPCGRGWDSRCVRNSSKCCASSLALKRRNSISRARQRPDASTNGSGPRRTVTSRTSFPPRFPLASLMYLINAIYFKAPWTFEFDPDDTRTEPFYPEDRSTRTVPLMTILRDFPYLETGRFQAVDLPYGGGAFSMTVLVPRDGLRVDDVLLSLDAAAWRDIAGGFEEPRCWSSSALSDGVRTRAQRRP